MQAGLTDATCAPCRCKHKVPYDGAADGIFNLSNHTLFLHEPLFTYWDNMTVMKLPYNAHHQGMLMAHKRTYTDGLMPGRAIVR